MKQIQVKRGTKKTKQAEDEPERDYGDPAIVRAKAAKRKQGRGR